MAEAVTMPEPTVLGSLYVIEMRPPYQLPRAVAVCPAGTTLAEARAECRRLERYAEVGVIYVPARVPVRVPRG